MMSIFDDLNSFISKTYYSKVSDAVLEIHVFGLVKLLQTEF